MPQKRYKPEEIINELRSAEVELSKGHTTGQICRKLGITEQTYYRWRKQYGGMKVEQARRFKELEAENARIISVADTYDAITSSRVYRKGLSPELAFKEIERGAGTQFDPKLAILFVDLMKKNEKMTDTQTEAKSL